MVLLTVVAPSNNHTIYFRHPLPKPNYIRLISCLLYNSWYNLKKDSKIFLYDNKKKHLRLGPYLLAITLLTA